MRTVLYDEQELIDRATRAYFRRFGKHAPFPGRPDCRVTTRGVVILGNVNGELARYQHHARSDRLSFVR